MWGVVSDLDLARAIAAGALTLTGQVVSSSPAVMIGADESLRRAAELMVAAHAAHLMVVKRGRPSGVISTLDLARALADAKSP